MMSIAAHLTPNAVDLAAQVEERGKLQSIKPVVDGSVQEPQGN